MKYKVTISILLFFLAKQIVCNQWLKPEGCAWHCPHPLVQAEKNKKICICLPPSGRPIISRLLEDALVKVIPYGYVILDVYRDSRQVIGTRENQVLFFPAPYLPDIHGRDIDKHPQLHMTAVQTRPGFVLEGPRWGSVTSFGAIETDFRGISDGTTDTIRMRFAFGQLQWPSGLLLFGRFWHPLFITECTPWTVSYNLGAPMEPQGRVPMLLVAFNWGRWQGSACASSQNEDFASFGPIGQDSSYIRNADFPNLTFDVRAYFGSPDVLVGCTVSYKQLVPRIVSDKNVKVNERIASTIGQIYSALIYAPVSIRTKLFYAQNGSDQLLISGFGVRTINPVTDFRTYENTAAAGGWLDASYIFYCDKMELGLFLGGTKNLGARRPLFVSKLQPQPIVYTFVPTIADKLDYVFRVSPRWVWGIDPIRVGIELEYTQASFGRRINRFARPINPIPVANFRFLAGLFYAF